MTIEIALVFLVTAIALFLFATETFRADVTALIVLVTLMLIPLLGDSRWLRDHGINLAAAFPTVEEGLSGLSSTATVTVLAMFILSSGIQRSGLIHLIGKALVPMVQHSELRQILVIALLVGPISGFINNTAAVAVAIPLVIEMSKNARLSATRLLLPVSFFGMLGGMLTVVGTSTNILASSILRDRPEYGRDIPLFEFTHIGLLVLAAGVIYFMTVGRWLLPERRDSDPDLGGEQRFVVELRIPEGSKLAGETLKDKDFATRSGAELLKLIRHGRAMVKDADSTRLKPGDIIMIRATVRCIMDLLKQDDVEVLSDFAERGSVGPEGQLVRVLLRNHHLFGRASGSRVNFWVRYGARLVGLELEEVRRQRLRDEKLGVGTIVLLGVSRSTLLRLRRHPDLIMLGEFKDDFDAFHMWLSAGIVAAVIAGAAFTPVPIVVSALIGVIMMVVTGCVAHEDLYSGVPWEIIFLLAGLIPLGIAMTKSGAADWIAGSLAQQAAGWHPILVLMSLYCVTTLLTELVSNNAAVVILVPVAVSVADLLGFNVLPLVLAVMFAASTSFLSPMGYQTNTMIYGTGLYRFADFARVGAPLNAVLMVIACLAIYGLFPIAADPRG